MMLSFVEWLNKLKIKKHPYYKYLLEPISVDLPNNRFMSGDFKIFESRKQRDVYINSQNYRKFLDELRNNFIHINEYKKK